MPQRKERALKSRNGRRVMREIKVMRDFAMLEFDNMLESLVVMDRCVEENLGE